MLNKLNFTPFPALRTKRLVLRKLTLDDVKEIMTLRSNEQVNEFLERPKSSDLHEAEKFIEKIVKGIDNNEWIYWAITLKEKDVLVETIYCWNISIENDMAEIGYELHPTYHGKGIMHEAILKVIDYGFKKMKLKVITAFTDVANSKSIKVLEKNNFMLDTNHKYSTEADHSSKQLAYYLLKK